VSRIGGVFDLVLNRVDAWRHHGEQRDAELLDLATSATLTAADRAGSAFQRQAALRAFGHKAVIEGRTYPYVVLPGRGSTLCIHYSAFFGEWGDRRQYRAQFQGWFHRLRMFWPLAEHHFLFLCDTFGADANGTYYKGENGDYFVERAMDLIQRQVGDQLGIGAAHTVTLGSSMGATAALRSALRHGYAGAVAVSPHIDLDISALTQGRLRHVSAIVGREDIDASDLRPVMREVAQLAARVPVLPSLVIQSMKDDHGVHAEQVLPLVATWETRGGRVLTDFHPTGGHTSDYATAEFFERAIAWCLGSASMRDHG
jgi:pimeloyl-ACP methyl ester carboxylesterase